jgi:PAS domain S-box-containing protein
MSPFLRDIPTDELEHDFARLAEVCDVTLFLYDLRERKSRATRSLAERLGYAEAEFDALGPSWIEALIHPEDRDRFKADNAKYMKVSDREAVHTEYRFRNKAGSYVWIASWAAVVSRTEKGEPARAIGVSLDITEDKRTLAEKEALEAKVQASRRLEALGTLAGGVAHDFNNLLTILVGSLGVLRQGDGCSPMAAEAVEAIQECVQRSVRLTGQLLAFARSTAPHRQSVDLSALTRELLPEVRRRLPVDIALVADLAPSLPPVSADPAQIEQVLMNLVANAAEAMPTGGELRVTTRGRSRQEGTRGPQRRSVELAVADTGTGIDEAVRPHLFEPFFTTKARGKGAGLGLAVCYGIVQQHEGAIEIESAEEKGTVVRVVLPESAARAAAPGAAREPPRAAGEQRCVLLVEDEPRILAVMTMALEAGGFQVLQASSGYMAQEIARGSPRVDLLVTDVIMSGMNGRQLAESLRASDPELPVIFMSGYTDQVFGHDKLGAATFLQKPFAPSELVRRVRQMLEPKS